MISILTHRGLDPSIEGFPFESSFEAFKNHLEHGYGLELDLAFLSDGSIGIIHDSDLARLSSFSDRRKVSELTSVQFCSLRFQGCRFMLLDELLRMLISSKAEFHALHFKGKLQNQKNVDLLCKGLSEYPEVHKKLIIFDLLPDTARRIYQSVGTIGLACSISRPYDIKRYGDVTGNTLLSIEQFISYQDLFSWVWLDEWDVSTEGGQREEFYCEYTFSELRKTRTRIALVSPELHGTSPGLLAGEAHQDALGLQLLTARMSRIIALKPDAICTDYPAMLRNLISS